jgi:NAD(P)-dependent dehydrogenase (short-subunit alcohol dehydrogenase family)
MAGRLAGKVALVTGAAGGMGHTTAELFASEGAKVIAADIKPPEPAFESADVETADLDVSEEDSWRSVVAGIVERHGRLDVLVNNAGIIAYEAIEDLDLVAWHRIISVDQTGVFLGMREVVPIMRSGGGGSIINISSIWGSVAVAGAHAYHATKGAVRNMTKNVAMSHVADGIRVNSIHPGYILTPLTAVQAPEVNQLMIDTTPMKRPGQPIEVAYGSLYLASDESSYVTGIELVIDGGYLAQ